MARLLGLMFSAVVILSTAAPVVAGLQAGDDYGMSVNVDETKVSIESGNLTLGIVTGDWPRLVFWHTYDPFSPTFDIGFPRLYLFDDTDLDGRFCRAEAVHTVFLDSNRVQWNRSTVWSDYDDEKGESVVFSMTTFANAYNATLDSTPSIESWANITFWFRLTENESVYDSPMGPHTVRGKIDLYVNMTIDVVNHTDPHFLAVETFVQGGGTTNTFHILEDGEEGAVAAVLSSRVDESQYGDEFTRPLNSTAQPVQCIELAKEDGTEQAFFKWDSYARAGGGDPGIQVNSSCYTTGVGLMLHSALRLSEDSGPLSIGSSVGIFETGFVGTMTDWLMEYRYAVAISGLLVAVIAVVGLHVALRRRRRKGDVEGSGGR